jgi:hypothetical protein
VFRTERAASVKDLAREWYQRVSETARHFCYR